MDRNLIHRVMLVLLNSDVLINLEFLNKTEIHRRIMHDLKTLKLSYLRDPIFETEMMIFKALGLA